MDQDHSASLMTLIYRREEAIGRGEAPSVTELCRDQPEMTALLEREIALREITRLGIVPVGGDGNPFCPVAGSVPVPGYRLVRRVGAGGSGEVWRAVGPGGFAVALKFIRMTGGGSFSDSDSLESLRNARQTNLRSLELVRELRHPNLLTLIGAWERDGLLIIGMELADRTLMDRLVEALEAGLPGIPLPELLDSMRQVARGIDYLNTPGRLEADRAGGGIQHRDIKPQNLLLVGDVVKLGDFGLAKLRDELISETGSLTATYAAPELFEGKVSRRSDQYALAVTFCKLRGGAVPFGGSLYEVMRGHSTHPPDLGMLPAAERPAVARALAKNPDDRWPDCRALVEAIAAAAKSSHRRAALGHGRTPAVPARRLVLASLFGLAASSIAPGRHHWAKPSVPGTAATTATSQARPMLPEPASPSISAPPRPEASSIPTRTEPTGPVVASPSLDPTPPPTQVAARTSGKGDSPPIAPQATTNPPPGGAARPNSDRPSAPSQPAETAMGTRDQAPVVRPERGSLPTAPPTIVSPPAGDAKPSPDRLGRSQPEAGPDPAVPHPAGELSLAAPTPPIATELPAPSPPRVATIEVLMPSATAELAVRGAVGKGQPDEWYGPRRVIHTPPLTEGQDYLVGAFWLDPSRVPTTRNRRLHVQPGMTYEVDLRPATPTFRTIGGHTRPPSATQGTAHEDPRDHPDPGGAPAVRR